MTDKPRTDFASVESRRSSASTRRMSVSRRLYYFFGLPLLRGTIRVLNASYRYEPLIGEQYIESYIGTGAVCAPCYWHQQHLLCTSVFRRWIGRGFKACFLVSGSVDGEVPDRLARSWGAEVIRGSANQSGALALRDMQGMMKRGYSIITTADGPRGPIYEFKAGAVLMARIAGIPIIPMACAADRAWYLKRWDNFMIPKPFARVAVAIGVPYPVPPDVPLDAIEPHRLNVQQAVMSLMTSCTNAVKSA